MLVAGDSFLWNVFWNIYIKKIVSETNTLVECMLLSGARN